MLDSHWPEFDRFIEREARPDDLACVSMPGRQMHNERYAWRLRGVADMRHTFALAAMRGFHPRTLAAQGVARQRVLLEWDRLMGQVMARHLGPRVTREVVSQNLLPALWAEGPLQGRRFEVLMERPHQGDSPAARHGEPAAS